MKTGRFYQVTISVCLTMTILFPQNSVSAQDLNFVDIPLEIFHDEKPLQLQGLISSQTLNIPLPQSWLLGDENWMEIRIQASPLLDSERSSLTISINGASINSYNLAEVEKTTQRILLPGKLFTQGNNNLTFTGTLYLPDDQQTNCQNWGDPSRWLMIEPGGLLHLSFAKRDLQADLSNFPGIFLEPLQKYLPDEAKRQTLIVLPKNNTQDDLTSLSTLSYVLGNYAGIDFDWHPEIVNETQLDTKVRADRNIIFIGSTPNEFQDRVTQDKDYLALFPSPWGMGNAVMIVGDQNRQDGFSPVSVFRDRARSILLHGDMAYIDPQTPPPRQPFPNHFSFEELGYLDRTVRGIGQQSLIYNLYIPYDTEPVLVKLNLGLVHSPELDIQNSSFTVFLNGFSIAGILPTARSSAGEPITIGLPARKFRRGINFIRVAFDLHVPYHSCERALETVWATVLNSSTLDVTYRNRVPIPSLKDFPLPFNDSGSILVIPDQYSLKDLAYLSRLSFMLGSSADGPSRPPEVMIASNFKQRESEHSNAILVGLPSENLVTRNANDLLPQPFAINGNSLQEGYGVYLPTSNKDASLGIMQVIRSPWVKDGTVLVLTGNDQQGLEWVWRALLNPALQNSFAGNVMVIGFADRNQSLGELSVQESPRVLFQQIADASNIPIIGPMLQRTGQAFMLPVLIAIGTALLLVVCTLWVSRMVRSRKNRL